MHYLVLVHVQNDEIDEINIHQATLKAMQEAIINLPITPDLVYVDGKFTPNVEVNCEAVIGGDMLISEISAASIIAKVYRDEIMKELDKKFPVYGFASNKGYGTAQHLAALKNSGYTSFHRLSFRGVIALIMHPSFVHLRVSSEYSISRGLLRINEIIERAVKLKDASSGINRSK